jgi:hypothetical protein
MPVIEQSGMIRLNGKLLEITVSSMQYEAKHRSINDLFNNISDRSFTVALETFGQPACKAVLFVI